MKAHAKAAERLRAEPVAWPTTVRVRPTRVRVW
jgi:hypothetical protein